MTKPRWLWIAAEVTDTPTTGLLVYSNGLSTALADHVDITMIGLGRAGTARPNIDVKPIAGSLRGGWRSLLSGLPNLSYACATPAMRAAVQAEIARDCWDAVVIDHLQTAWVADLLPADGPPSIFVTHNHEGSVRKKIAFSIPVLSPRGLPLRFDAMKAARLERRAISRASVVSSITEADQKQFLADDPTKRHVVVKPGWSGDLPKDPPVMAERPRRVGIIGSFEWHAKQENLRRFVRDAGPTIEAAGAELFIAGSMPDALATELEAECPAITVVGWVDSVTDFLSQCRIGVVAEPHGGGFKLKSLEYIVRNVVIAATSGSLEGLPLTANHSMIESESNRLLGVAIAERINDPSDLDAIADAALRACGPMLRWEDQVTAVMAAMTEI